MATRTPKRTVQRIVSLAKQGHPQVVIAQKTNVSAKTVWRILKNVKKTCRPQRWPIRQSDIKALEMLKTMSPKAVGGIVGESEQAMRRLRRRGVPRQDCRIQLSQDAKIDEDPDSLTDEVFDELREQEGAQYVEDILVELAAYADARRIMQHVYRSQPPLHYQVCIPPSVRWMYDLIEE
jgi:hypothetical protein